MTPEDLEVEAAVMRQALDRADLLLTAGRVREAHAAVKAGWQDTTAGRDLRNRLRQLETWYADLSRHAEPRAVLRGLAAVVGNVATDLESMAAGERASRDELRRLARTLREAEYAAAIGQVPDADSSA